MRFPHALRRARLIAALIAFSIAGSACQVDVAVNVDVESDGSGTLTADLTLDADAVKALRGGVAESLEFADLRDSGWAVVINPVDAGGARITAHRAFEGPAQLGTLVQELSGEQGPLREVSLERDRSILQGRYRFNALMDLRGAEAGMGGDSQLADTLRSAGVDQSKLEELLRSRIAQEMTVRLSVDLPGSGRVERVAKPGKLTELAASSSTWAYDRIALLALAALLLVLGFTALARDRWRRVR